MKQITPFILTLLCVILLSSKCKHDCSDDKPRQVFLPQEVLDFVDFKAGTYWVYQDSATGRIDSEVVVSSRHVMDDVSSTNECGDIHIGRQYENIEMVIQRYDALGNKKESWIRKFNNFPKMTDPKEDNVFYINNNASFLIGYPFNLTFGTINEFLSDSLVFNGTKYYNIIKVVNPFDGTNDFVMTDCFAKKIGRLYVGTVGNSSNDFQKVNLIRYKIM